MSYPLEQKRKTIIHTRMYYTILFFPLIWSAKYCNCIKYTLFHVKTYIDLCLLLNDGNSVVRSWQTLVWTDQLQG
jgi:hypothetical protein